MLRLLSAALAVALPAVAVHAMPESESPSEGTCPPAPLVRAETVAANWPSMLGQRVTIVEGVAIDRAIDFTEVIVVAGARRFAVVMPPDRRWSGRARHTFRVLGSTRVPLLGRTVLPELLLENDGCEQ